MELELTIKWSGEAPGLSEHAFSVAIFCEALVQLLACVKRAASNELKNAVGAAEVRAHGGRYAKVAEEIDLRLVEMLDNCVTTKFIVHRPQSQDAANLLFDPMLERAVERVLQDIEGEARGELRNELARKYLLHIPHRVDHDYELRRGGQVIRRAHVGAPKFSVLPELAPRSQILLGEVASVGFPPGPSFIGVKVGGRVRKYEASPAMVERALHLRGATVRAAVITGARDILLWVRAGDEPFTVPDEGARTQEFLDRWSGLLARLA